MMFNQLSVLYTLLLFVVVGLYYWVYHVSLRINSIPERIWGPAWLTMLLFGILCCWIGTRDVMSSGTKGAELISLGVISFFCFGLFYFFWWVGLEGDDY